MVHTCKHKSLFGMSAALTAPLPYTSSKTRKGGASRQADLPRAVLFDMTNNPTPQDAQEEVPDSPRKEGDQTGAEGASKTPSHEQDVMAGAATEVQVLIYLHQHFISSQYDGRGGHHRTCCLAV